LVGGASTQALGRNFYPKLSVSRSFYKNLHHFGVLIQFLTDLGFYPWSQAQLARRMKAFPSLIEAQLSAPKGSFSFLTE
jgi:hypothetical protein